MYLHRLSENDIENTHEHTHTVRKNRMISVSMALLLAVSLRFVRLLNTTFLDFHFRFLFEFS